MKPVTSRVEWPSFPRTKTETGTEMSVPVSIHIAITGLAASVASALSQLQGLSVETPVALGFGDKSVATKVYDLIVSYNKGIRHL